MVVAWWKNSTPADESVGAQRLDTEKKSNDLLLFDETFFMNPSPSSSRLRLRLAPNGRKQGAR